MAEEEKKDNGEKHSKLMEYVYMGIAIGIGTLLVWDLTTTNDNTKQINDLIKDVGGMQKDHTSEVNRSSDVDADQEIDIKENKIELKLQRGWIYDNRSKLGILFDRFDRDAKDLPPLDYNK